MEKHWASLWALVLTLVAFLNFDIIVAASAGGGVKGMFIDIALVFVHIYIFTLPLFVCFHYKAFMFLNISSSLPGSLRDRPKSRRLSTSP